MLESAHWMVLHRPFQPARLIRHVEFWDARDTAWCARLIGPVIADYVSKDAKRRELQPKFDIDKPYVLVPREEFETFFKGKGTTGWKAFYEAHPESGGIVEFSAVGFNHSKTIAMVRMSTSCGSLCGGGTYHLLQKKNGKWQPLQLKSDGGRSCAWAS